MASDNPRSPRKKTGAAKPWWQAEIGRKGIGGEQLCVLTEGLALFKKSGLPLDQGLSIMRQMAEDRKLAEVIDSLHAMVRGGHSLSDAMRRHPRVFPPAYVGLVHAGEISGSLEQVFGQLAEGLRRSQEIQRQLTGMLIYPAILMLVSLVAIMFILFYVLPVFVGIFDDMNTPLPASARILLGFGAFAQKYWWLLLSGLAGLLLGLAAAWKKPSSRLKLEAAAYRVPFLSRLLCQWQSARYFRTLGLLVQGGVPLAQACPLALEAVTSRHFRQALAKVDTVLKEGHTFARALKATRVIPQGPLSMVTLGEEAGNLESMLMYAAQQLEAKVQSHLSRLVSLAQPVVILGMGLVVGGIVVTLINTILTMTYGGL